MSFIPWKDKQQESDEPAVSRLASLRSEMDRLFDTFVREPLGAVDWPLIRKAKWSPAVDVTENDEEVTVHAEVPGIEPEDLDVTISGTELVLSGEKKEPSETSGKDSCQAEIRFGSFRRTVRLPQVIDTENVDARYANGVLTLRLKKLRPTQPRRIEVKVKGQCAAGDQM